MLNFDFNDLIVINICQNRNRIEIFSCRTQHRRTTNINELYFFVKRNILVHVFKKRIEIHNHHINQPNFVLLNCFHMFVIGTNCQQSAVNFWVKRFHSSVQHLWKIGYFINLDWIKTSIFQMFESAACGNQFVIVSFQKFGKIYQTAFIRYADKCSLFVHKC